MASSDDSRYGGNWWPVFRANWQDRRTGLSAAIRARQGYLRQPHGEGKVVWIKAGENPESVRLACELLGTLRERRRDIRLALTFEHDYPEIIEPRVKGLRKIGLGYGPSDRPGSVKRVMTRLNPFGLILVDTVPHPNLLHAAVATKTHLMAFNTQPTPVMMETAYPVDAKQVLSWKTSGMAMTLMEPADPASLFVESQVDTTLRSLVSGGHGEFHLWWWHDELSNSPGQAMSQWRASALAQNGVLFISGKEDDADSRSADLCISTWDRTALPAGTVVWIDDPRWFAAISSAATAAYVNTRIRKIFWQSLAGGCVMMPGTSTCDLFPDLTDRAATPAQIPEVYTTWMSMMGDPQASRRIGDTMRRLFWQERRKVKSNMEDFANRIFNW